MKISIITVVYNNADTIEDCIKSVFSQSHKNIEHIIIDGSSTDGTVEVIKRYEDKVAYWVSEKDNGIYDAMGAVSG
jgi:Glycosyltransferases involved in cell wall biogenesis